MMACIALDPADVGIALRVLGEIRLAAVRLTPPRGRNLNHDLPPDHRNRVQVGGCESTGEQSACCCRGCCTVNFPAAATLWSESVPLRNQVNEQISALGQFQAESESTVPLTVTHDQFEISCFRLRRFDP